MENMEKLKKVKINELTKDEILIHKENILKLSKDEIIEYLTYAIDTFYKIEEEGENDDNVEFFFDLEEFKPFYNFLMDLSLEEKSFCEEKLDECILKNISRKNDEEKLDDKEKFDDKEKLDEE
jgi:hypothetical protein